MATNNAANIPLKGQRILLSSQTASSSSAIQFTGVTGYSYYEIDMFEVVTSTTETLGLQFSTNNGVSYSSSGYDNEGVSQQAGAVGGFSVNTGSFFYITDSDLGGAGSVNAKMSIFCLGNSALNKIINSQCSYTNSGGFIYLDMSGEWGTTTVVNAIQIIPDTGTITSGHFNLYGIV
jgi:hypothetical protein